MGIMGFTVHTDVSTVNTCSLKFIAAAKGFSLCRQLSY